MTHDFSIVTPSFNQAQFIGATLKSVAMQRGVTVQHVVIDPGSMDGSQDVIRTFPHVNFFEEPDNCQSQGINNGFAKCTGTYMAWLNSDDVYPSPDVLAIVKQCFENNPNVEVIYGNAEFIDQEGKFLRKYYVNGSDSSLAESLQYQVGICQPAVFWKRSVYAELGGLDESLNYQLDFEYWIRLNQAGKKWKHAPQVLASHRWWAGMKTASRRDLSLREALNLVKQRYKYVHYKWADRLAALQVDASDGIINVGQIGSEPIQRRANEILKLVNTDSSTLEFLQAPDANPPIRETLARMLGAGIDCTPRFPDATALDISDQPPTFLFPQDAHALSVARRPEIRTRRSTAESYLIYGAEPSYVVAQKLSDYQVEQQRLSKFLQACKASERRTCVVVANGPSLKHSLNDDLFGLDLIISNFAYKDERLLKYAKYFTIVNHTVAAQVYADWMQLEHLTKFFPFWLGRHVPALSNLYYVNSTVTPTFSSNALSQLSWRSTVSYFNMQLAAALGYQRILLVGFDNSYVQPAEVREGDELVQIADDPNHFMPGYFKGKTWQAADTGNMNDSYCEALQFAMEGDVEIINCTVGGQLHAFPRGSLAELANPNLKIATEESRSGWRRLTPGEVSACAARANWRAELLKRTPAHYASLSPDLRAFLLKEAVENGRRVIG